MPDYTISPDPEIFLMCASTPRQTPAIPTAAPPRPGTHRTASPPNACTLRVPARSLTYPGSERLATLRLPVRRFFCGEPLCQGATVIKRSLLADFV